MSYNEKIILRVYNYAEAIILQYNYDILSLTSDSGLAPYYKSYNHTIIPNLNRTKE